MKRFLCTTCFRIVRTRSLPADARPNLAGHQPGQHTIGTCAHHGSTSRTRANDRGRVVAGLGSTRRTSASKDKTQSKKGGA